MVECTKEEMWQTVWIFTNNSNFEMFYCKDMVWIGFQQGLHTFLNTDCKYNHKPVLACGGLVTIPSSRCTFDRRLKTISTEIKE